MEPIEAENASIYQANITKPEDLRALHDVLQEKDRIVDTLVCNAGITQDHLFLRLTEEHWREVIDTNVTGTFLTIKQFLKGMVKKTFGRIVLLGSVSGSIGNLGQANYAASKAALCGLAKSLAREVAGKGITVNVVAPGFIATAMTATLGDRLEHMKKMIPIGRLGLPEEVASVVSFLVSEEAAYITGETIHVNGGLHMNP